VSYKIITYLRSVALNVCEKKSIFVLTESRQIKQKRNDTVGTRNNSPVTTKSEAATCYKKSVAAGFSTGSLSELIWHSRKEAH
jgi:hypothetical protein